MLTSKLFVLCGLMIGPSQHIDEQLAIAQARNDVSPAKICSDDAFLRRISLDLIGRIPTRDELHAFRSQPDRPAKVDELLNCDDFPRFWADVWTAAFIGHATRAFGVSREPLRIWVKNSIRDGVPYDSMVRQLIAAEGDSAFDGPVNFLVRHREQPAVKVSRMFLGIRLDCARCHDHPFGRWTRQDFDSFGRFFESINYREISEHNFRLSEAPRHADLAERPVFLSGARPQTSRWRDELALMVTSCKPFARTYANRMWYHFLGRGIVDPPDDFSANEAVAPELLLWLTDYARETDFDIRTMIRAICNSNAYQRAGGQAGDESVRRELFATYAPKPLMAEQLLSSFRTAFDLNVSVLEQREQLTREVDTTLDADFSRTWEYRDNVQTVMTRLVRTPPLNLSSTTSIYETILSRAPVEREVALCRGRKTSQIVFALIHSNEFRFNH
jgi:hypothetical protein